jgi:hypothetical protein
MEQETFDLLARRLSTSRTARRSLTSGLGAALLAGALSEVVVRFGIAEVAAKQRHGRRVERHGQVHDEMRRRKKKRHKKAKRPQEPQACSESERRCPDGTCVNQESCCAGERVCDDGACLAGDQCCSGEVLCDDGSCISPDQCCPTAKRCSDGSCIARNQCCPEALPPNCGECQMVICDAGELVCTAMCQGEGIDCCNGWCWYACPPSSVRNFVTCECECPSGSELLADGSACCPNHRTCGRNDAGLATFCCDEANICRASGQECS